MRPGISDLDLSKVPHHLSHSPSTLIHWYCALMSNFPVCVCVLHSSGLVFCSDDGSVLVQALALRCPLFRFHFFSARRFVRAGILSSARSVLFCWLLIWLHVLIFFIVFCSWRSVFLLSVASLLFVLFCTSIIMLLQFLFVVVFFSMLHPTFWFLQFFALSRSSVQCFFSLDFFCFNIPPVLFYY